MINKLKKPLLILFLFLNFSQLGFGNTLKEIATIINTAEPKLIYKLSIELNDDNDIVAFVKNVYSENQLLSPESKRFPLGIMKMGVLVEKLGIKVLKYDPSYFSSHSGGVLPIYYAKDFITSRFTSAAYGKINVKILRDGDEWILYNSRNEIINFISVEVKRNMFGIPKGIGRILSKLDL